MPSAPAATSAAELVSAAASATAPAAPGMGGSAATSVRLASGIPRRAKSIGHTSYVLKVALDNGAVGAFKPCSNKPLGDRRYKGEIAAYRLAEALGLDNVPLTIARAFRVADLRGALSPDAQGEFDRMVRAGLEGEVEGALIGWIDGYEVLPLESAAWRSRWMPWLTDRHTEIAPSDRAMARAISTLIAFDCVTANWDRWSGANVARDKGTGSVLYVDNDGAFYDEPPSATVEEQFALLGKVVRFSESFVQALRQLDIETLRHVLGSDERGTPLLADRNILATDSRRRRALQIVDATVAREGQRDAFAFE